MDVRVSASPERWVCGGQMLKRLRPAGGGDVYVFNKGPQPACLSADILFRQVGSEVIMSTETQWGGARFNEEE
ncbi:unnamed protein product [Arctogadus glacialis]